MCRGDLEVGEEKPADMARYGGGSEQNVEEESTRAPHQRGEAEAREGELGQRWIPCS